MFKKVFEKGKVGTLEIKNRFIVPPMLTEYANADGSINERYIRYYEEKAKGGWGLIIVEDNAVEPRGAGFKNLAGIWSDEIMKEHVELTRRVHEAGAKIAVQVYHAGREASQSIMGERPVAPSAIQDPTIDEVPVELSTEEVKELVQKFVDAIRRCKEVGYDAVELHGAHGYLINQFVSPFSNKRTDEYGGTLMNRLRFPLEIIKQSKALLGNDFPIIYRMSADEMVEGGLTIEDSKVIGQILEENGVDALHVSAGVYKSGAIVSAPTSIRSAVFSDYAKEIKKVVDIPVFAVNKIFEPHMAESILKEGKSDFIAMGRASIADPHLPNKVLENRLDDILYCVGCWQGCQGKITKQEAVSCLVNPVAGKENEYQINEADEKKKVLVIGGGIAGMQTAIVLSRRGHQVTLVERSNQLGGQWLLAAIPPGKETLNTLTVSLKRQVSQLNINVQLNTYANEEYVNELNPDEIVMATGADPITPKIKGAKLNHVYQANDILSGKVTMTNDTVVIGGGLVGAETAEHIAVHNKSVTLIEMSGDIASEMDAAPRHFLLKSLRDNRVKVLTNTKVDVINDQTVSLSNGETLDAKQVVLAIGSKSNDELFSTLNGYKVHMIGDANQVGKALEAMNEAYEIGLNI